MTEIPELLELREQHRRGQDKYTYFLLAAAASGIAFAVNKTEGLSPSWWLTPVAAAAFCWGLSFFAGCRAICWVQASVGANYNLVCLEFGLHPEQPADPQDLATAKSGVRAALANNMSKADTFSTWQFRLLIAGALLFIAWRILEMARTTGGTT
jgi:hypothetical protein